MVSALEERRATITIAADEVRALSLGDSDHLVGLAKMGLGYMVAGEIGGLIGALNGRRNTMVVIACERDGFEFAAVFAAKPVDARQFITRVQSARHAARKSPLPSLEDVKTDAPDSEGASLAEVVALLTAQNALLERIAAAVER